MQGLIAKKVGMTRILGETGEMIPVTLLKVEDQKVTKILTNEKNGYSAVQVGYYAKPEHRLNKPDLMRVRKAGVEESFTRFKEFRYAAPVDGVELGSSLTAELLAEASMVDVTGVTKGHGFEGAITRWGHKTGRRTHGSHFHRRPGSLGQRTTPGRVFKNKEQPGHMGDVQRTVQNLKVVDVDTEANVIAIKGSVPGHRNGFVVVQASIKA